MLGGMGIDGCEYIRIDAVTGYGLQRRLGNEVQRVRRGCYPHFCACLDEQADQFRYLIRRNSPADTY